MLFRSHVVPEPQFQSDLCPIGQAYSYGAQGRRVTDSALFDGSSGLTLATVGIYGLRGVMKLDLIGQVLDQKYYVEKELGKGGMGAVFLATHLGTDRPVAIKVIAPQFMSNDEFVERFRREAKAAGRMRHPNVVDVTDFGFADLGGERLAYLVMEYLDGCTLAQVLAEEPRLPLDWVVDIMEQTCSAVDEAHQQGIIHRDLKPDNIWLEPNRRGGYTVKVLDFGLAKLRDPHYLDQRSGGAQDSASMEDHSALSLMGKCRTREDQPGAQGGPAAGQKTQLREDDFNSNAPAGGQETLLLDDHDEEATRAAQSLQVDSPEQSTLILQAGQGERAVDESSTQMLPSAENQPGLARGSRRTQAGPGSSFPGLHSIGQRSLLDSASADGLTRVGSILGTPWYMSPEQCRRSATLDPRSDIYSLGVITFQMLTGHPPFAGDMLEVMKLHLEAAPPDVKKLRPEVPNAMAAIIMSALSKDPSDRPATAAGFGAALRASLDRTGTLLRRAMALYSEHFPELVRVSVLVQLPVVALQVTQLVILVLRYRSGRPIQGLWQVAPILLTAFVGFLAASVVTGITVRLIVQSFLAPLRPLDLPAAFAALKTKLRPLLTTMLMVTIGLTIGSVFFVIPGIIFYINASLLAPVVMIEGLKGRAAIRRSKSLVKRSRTTVIAIVLIQYAVPMILNLIIVTVILGYLGGMNKGQADLLRGLSTFVTSMLNLLLIPLIAALTALLYLKTRQTGGEVLRDVLRQFEQEDKPHAKWQLRMRERLSVHTPPER